MLKNTHFLSVDEMRRGKLRLRVEGGEIEVGEDGVRMSKQILKKSVPTYNLFTIVCVCVCVCIQVIMSIIKI